MILRSSHMEGGSPEGGSSVDVRSPANEALAKSPVTAVCRHKKRYVSSVLRQEGFVQLYENLRDWSKRYLNPSYSLLREHVLQSGSFVRGGFRHTQPLDLEF